MYEEILKRFEKPDEVRVFEKGKFELVRVGGMTIGRATYAPGWKWSAHVGKAAGAKSCMVESSRGQGLLWLATRPQNGAAHKAHGQRLSRDPERRRNNFRPVPEFPLTVPGFSHVLPQQKRVLPQSGEKAR